MLRATEPTFIRSAASTLRGFAMHFDISRLYQFNTYETNYTSIWYEIHLDTSHGAADTSSAASTPVGLRNALWYFSSAVPYNSIQYLEIWDKLTRPTEPPTQGINPCGASQCTLTFPGCTMQFNSILCNMRQITLPYGVKYIFSTQPLHLCGCFKCSAFQVSTNCHKKRLKLLLTYKDRNLGLKSKCLFRFWILRKSCDSRSQRYGCAGLDAVGFPNNQPAFASEARSLCRSDVAASKSANLTLNRAAVVKKTKYGSTINAAMATTNNGL